MFNATPKFLSTVIKSTASLFFRPLDLQIHAVDADIAEIADVAMQIAAQKAASVVQQDHTAPEITRCKLTAKLGGIRSNTQKKLNVLLDEID